MVSIQKFEKAAGSGIKEKNVTEILSSEIDIIRNKHDTAFVL